MDETEKTPIDNGAWVVLEIFGHKTVAGFMKLDDLAGKQMLRVEIPAVGDFPAFTRHYSPDAIYSITYVSEEAAVMVAAQIEDDPISVYVPDLGNIRRMREENERLNDIVGTLRSKLQLPESTFTRDD